MKALFNVVKSRLTLKSHSGPGTFHFPLVKTTELQKVKEIKACFKFLIELTNGVCDKMRRNIGGKL